MRHTVILVCLLMVLAASVASADVPQTWTSQLGVFGHPETWISVLTTATDMVGHWNWTYALTPHNADNIRSLTITLGPADVAMAYNITGPPNWSIGIESGQAIYWQTPGNGSYTLDSSQNETFIYGFDDLLGPSLVRDASAVDTYGYSGPVHGPAPVPVPEPMSVLLGIMGLSSVVGFGKLRRK